MPAKTYNAFSNPVDGIVFLFITAELPDPKADGINVPYPADTVKLLVDEKFWLRLFIQKWYWDRKQKKCFGYITEFDENGNRIERGKVYLQRYIWEMELGGHGVGKVFMSDPTDFRIKQTLHRQVAACEYVMHTNQVSGK